MSSAARCRATSSGSYNTVITVSDGTLTDTDSFTWTVTEPNPLITYVDDTFTRTSTNGWGSATPSGGAYTIAGTAANFAVNGGVGSMTSPSAGVVRSALLNTPSAADVDVSFRVRTDKLAVGGAQFVYAVVRRNGANEYRVKLRMAPNGAVFVSASTLINNVETTIGSEVQVPGLTHAANTFIRFRAQVSGANPTTLRIRAWADAAARADDLAIHPDQQQRQPAGRRSTRPAHLHRLGDDQRAGCLQLRRLPRDEHRRSVGTVRPGLGGVTGSMIKNRLVPEGDGSPSEPLTKVLGPATMSRMVEAGFRDR